MGLLLAQEAPEEIPSHLALICISMEEKDIERVYKGVRYLEREQE